MLIFFVLMCAQVLDDGPKSAEAAPEDQLPAHQKALSGPGAAVRGRRLPGQQQVTLKGQKTKRASDSLAQTTCKFKQGQLLPLFTYKNPVVSVFLWYSHIPKRRQDSKKI